MNEYVQNTASSQKSAHLHVVGRLWPVVNFLDLNSLGMHPSNVHLCPTMVAVGATKMNLDADTVMPTFSKCCRM
jgi:hypothetical protein